MLAELRNAPLLTNHQEGILAVVAAQMLEVRSEASEHTADPDRPSAPRLPRSASFRSAPGAAPA